MSKKSGILCVLAVAALIGLGAAAGLAQDKVYVNGFDAAYPPFSFVDKDGKPAGFDIDALDWIAKEMKFKVKHQPTDWAAIVPTLQAKKIDVRFSKKVLYEIDGGARTKTRRLKIRIRPKSLTVCVPASALPVESPNNAISGAVAS